MEAAEVANGVGNEGSIDKAVVTTDEVEDLMAREEINVMVLDVLLCSIAEYFYELCRILTRPTGSSKYKQRVKILSDTTQQNV